ncbi:MAG: ATP-binding protein [Planctomycetota bacterium]
MGHKTEAKRSTVLWLIVVTMAGVFVLDVSTPTVYVVTALYILPLTLSLWLPQRRAPIVLAAIVSLLTVLAAIFSEQDLPLAPVLFNCGVSIVSISAFAALAYVIKRSQQGLEAKVAERTAELTQTAARLDQELAERKLAQEQLRKHADEINDLYNNSPCGYHSVDAEGVFLRINDTGLRWLGYTREEMVGKKKIWELIAPGRHESFEANFARMKEQGWAKDVETEFVRKDGTILPALLNASVVRDAAGQFIMTRSTVFDVTELRKAQEQIRLLASFPTESPNPILRITLNSEVAFANKPAGPLLRKWDCQVGECVPEELYETLAEALRTGQKLDTEIECEGRVFWLAWAPFPSSGYLNVYGSDITELRRAEEAQRKAQEQLLQAQKMEAIGQLAGGVAHEFNNMLFVISGQAELMLQNLPPDGELRGPVETILKTGDRLSKLTTQILAFSRRQMLQPKMLSLNEIVDDTNKLVETLIHENISLKTVLDPALKRTKADPAQIGQVLVNLIVNARDAMPRGGSLTVETANTVIDEAYCSSHPGAKPGPYVMLAVTDTGCGIDENVKAHLFEPFFTTKEVGKGTGLGLASANGIVRQSGGHIEVHSELGKGASFKVYLPQAEDADAWPSNQTRLPVPGGNETLLLVEDEEDVRVIACEMLRSLGYKVLGACDGTEALLAYEQAKGRVDLVVTDVVMPGMDGPDLAARLRQLRPDIKVIFASGYMDPRLNQQSRVEPSAHFLQKPIGLGVLARKVREVLDEKP